jgi:YD repeat-containing protein
MFEAARVTDGIEHSSALAGFVAGALLGIALIAAVAFCTFTCGFGVALVAGLVAGMGAQGLLMAGEAIGSAIKSTSGAITNGSPNVFTNSLAAAIAKTSGVVCSKHPPLPLVAEGSSSVFINGKPAARKGDHITCGAVIGGGSGNVSIGGGTKAVLPFDSEIPEWLRTATDWAFVLAGLAGGLAGVIRKAAGAPLKAMLPCAAKFMAGFAIGEAVGRYVVSPTISAVVGNPVELTTGRKILLAQDEIDFVLNGRLPLGCSRFYGSNLQYEGLLGRGWMHEWDVNLRLQEGEIIHTDFQGRETPFPQIKPGQKIYSVPEQRHLGCTEDGRYFIYGLDEIYYEFGPFAGPDKRASLCKIEDQVGQRISFERAADGRLQQIITSTGQRLRLHYAHQRLSAVELVAGGTPGVLVRYQYDANGQLSGVFNRLNQAMRSFAYENGLMVQHVNALGMVCQYRWQTIDGQPRVVEHRSSEGEYYQFGYDTAARKSWATDTFGRKASWRYDANFQVLESIYFDGSHHRFEYNADGNLTALHLPGERHVSFAYDELGRLSKETDPLGRISQTEYHQASLRPLCQTLPDASKWYAGYDPRGLLLSTQDPLGRRTLYTWGANGLLEKVVDARGGQKTMEWNGMRKAISSPIPIVPAKPRATPMTKTAT